MHQPSPPQIHRLRFGTAEVHASAALISPAVWTAAFGQSARDRRYYSLLERTLSGEFSYRYLLLRDAEGRPAALQPFFFVDQDIVAGSSRAMRRSIAVVRRVFPRFLRIGMLMAGCSAGEGDLGILPGVGDEAETTAAICEALTLIARKSGRSLVSFKDFSSRYRSAFSSSAKAGYATLPSFPSTSLSLDFPDFDTFVARRLGKETRKDLRRKFRRAEAGPPIEMEVCTDVAGKAEELHALYRQVLDRSEFRFEELTADYFREVGRVMPESVRFFIWRIEGRAVAFSLCMIHRGVLHDMYLGLDYRVALERHLYFVTLRDVFTWAIGQGIETYHSTALNYDPKLRLSFRLAPLDLYVRHSSPILNPIFRRIMPLFAPTTHDRTLPRFANFAEIENSPSKRELVVEPSARPETVAG